MIDAAAAAADPAEASVIVPAWVYRLDLVPPARHDGWRRAIRILHVPRPVASPRRLRRPDPRSKGR
jgi:hypothetical protein